MNVQTRVNSMENFLHQMYRSLGLGKNFEFIECTNSGKFDGKSKNVQNHENSMQNCVRQMYKYSRLVEKFVFVESTKSRKFNGKLFTLDIQIIQICKKKKINFVECTNS